jgi:hypothetical protein
MEAVQTCSRSEAGSRKSAECLERIREILRQTQSIGRRARCVQKGGFLVNYVKVEDLAHVWCEYAEMEIRHMSKSSF